VSSRALGSTFPATVRIPGAEGRVAVPARGENRTPALEYAHRSKRVSTEMGLHVLAYNIKRVIAIIGVGPLLQAIPA
jgi:hypothetical protein